MVNVGVVIIGLNLVRIGVTMSFEEGHDQGGDGIEEKTEVIESCRWNNERKRERKAVVSQQNSVRVCTSCVEWYEWN
jgi:hypothetical protein